MSEPEVQLQKLSQKTESPPKVQLQELSQKTESSPSNPETVIYNYKNRLQEFAQRASIPLPFYKHVNEGQTHAPKFRATVFVDGLEFVSPNTFFHLKAAEQDVARLALNGIYEKTKVDMVPFIWENMIFCKSILMEYTVKMHFEKPIYTTTTESNEVLPVFVSELIMNGVKFNGARGKSKKEAEHMAAQAALLSILDSGSRTVLSEIIKSKSKSKHFAAWSKFTDSSHIQSGGAMPVAENISSNPNVSLNKRKEMETTNTIANATAANLQLPVSGSSGTNLAPLSESDTNHQVATTVPFHEFRKPKAESSSEVIAAPPIIFVPPVLGETVECLPESGKKRRKNKKKKNAEVVGVLGNPQLPVVAATPLSQNPTPCQVPPSPAIQ